MAMAPEKVDSKRVVLVFATFAYRKILSNWISHAPLVVLRDLEVHAYGLFYPILLRSQGVKAVRVAMFSPARDRLWKDRVAAISMRLNQGYEVINCDADAVILQDFTESLAELQGDLIISQGLGHPRSAFEEWEGLTLCCGFAVYRPHESTIALMNLVQKFEGTGKYDDQTALNEVLVANSLEWDRPPKSYGLSGPRGQVTCFNSPVRARVNEGQIAGLDVVMLDHASYRRLPNNDETGDPIVFHPLPKVKGAAGVIATLKQNQLWAKRRKWL